MARNPETASHDDKDQRALAEEHRKNALRRLSERGRGNSVDAYDPSIGWTAQAGNGFTNPGEGDYMGDPNQHAPGQVFHVSQLPDPLVAQRAGFPPQQIPANFVVEDLEDAVLHPQGPGAGELIRSHERAATEEWMRRDIEAREEVRKAQEDSVGLTPTERSDLFKSRGLSTAYEDSQTRAAALSDEDDDGNDLEARQASSVVGGNVVSHPQGGAVERDAAQRAGEAGGGSETPSDAGSGAGDGAGGPDDGAGDGGDDSGDGETADYSDAEAWSYRDLQEEIKARNEGKDEADHISAAGSREELEQRLRDDDAKGE